MGFWKKILINTIVFLALAYFMQPDFYVSSFWAAFGASLVLGVLNVLIKPLLSLLSIPLNILTFGFFSFVINALMLLLTASFVGPGFYFNSFWTALVVALVMALVHSLLSKEKEA